MRFVEIIAVQEQPDVESLISNFVSFAADELELEQMPQIVLVNDGSLGTTFGCYSPGLYTIHLEIANRHPVDLLRTLAHELVHFRQDLDGVLHDESGKDGSEHENEANAEAGRIMRKFGKANPDLYRAQALSEARASKPR